jgi:uncharacterized coiled-coil DUF342 family protein
MKEERNKIRQAITELIKDIIEIKKKRDDIKERLKSIINSINEKRQRYIEILSEIKRIQIESKKSVEEKIIKEKKRNALEKLNKGERVSLYDLYIALEGDTTSSSS